MQWNESPVYPPEVVSSLTNKRLALIGFEEPDGARLLESLAPFRVVIESIPLSSNNPDSAWFRQFDLLVVQLPAEPAGIEWLNANITSPIHKPLLLIGPYEQLFKQASTNHLKNYDFLAFPWPPEEVVLRLHCLLVAASTQSGESAALASPEKVRVLVADDDPTIVATVRAVLLKHGMECIVAQNGGLAVTLVKAHHPHAVILDIHMPFLDGFEVLHTIKQNPQTCDIIVIMLTSLKFESDIVRGFKLGADDYIVKPFRPLELVARLNRLLQRPGTAGF
jgi:CheY-like chemotaxis protein